MQIHIFLKNSLFIFLIISKKTFLKSLAISSGNSSSLTQAWNQVAVIVHFYPILESSSGNLGPNLSISSQAQCWCWCLVPGKDPDWEGVSKISELFLPTGLNVDPFRSMNTYEAKYIPSEESLCTKSWGRGIFGLIEQINGGRHIFPYYEDLIGRQWWFCKRS